MNIKYKIIITPTAYKEINKIYEYITDVLYAYKAAESLIQEVEKQVQILKFAPKIYPQIKKVDELQRQYRRIVVKNFVVLYTIDEKNNVVFIAHMYYGGKNYMSIF